MISTSATRRPRTKPSPSAATAIAATIGLAAAGWAVAIPRMRGMDMGVATTLGSFPYFFSVWVPMMAAMMLPGVAPTVLRMAAEQRSPLDVVGHIGSYLTVWALLGVPIYAVYRPHSPATAGAIAVAAGVYELTPLKRRFRQSCRDGASSGWVLGLRCVGSSIGLMVVMLAFGAMSLTWMAVAAAVVLVQKVLTPGRAVDVPVATAVVALGLIELAR